MTGIHILEAMTDIEDAYITAAGNRLGYPARERRKGGGGIRKRHIFRKTVVLIAAVLFLMSAMLVTAMTVSEDFRKAVFQFLSIEQQEVVPEHNMDTEITLDTMYADSGRIKIGGALEAAYVHTPAASYALDGVYLICTDEIEMKQGSHYDAYYEENSEFIKLEEHSFCQDYTILNNDFHVEFDWVEHNGTAVFTYVDVDVSYRKSNRSDDINTALFWFSCTSVGDDGMETGTEYPVVIDLETGKLTDILAGTGAEDLMNIANSAISEDLSKMLLVQSDGTLYYVDITGKKLYSIDELSGEHAEACSLTGNALACWVRKDGYHAWNIDLTTFERRELFDGIPDAASAEVRDAGIEFMAGFDTWIRGSDMYAGSSFALETDGNRNVYVIDLSNGERIQIEGFLWPEERYPDIQCIPSPDGKKLLLCGGHTGYNYQYIGVLNFADRTYMEFSRENGNDVREHSAYWFDPDSIIIRTTATESSHDYYVYSITNE
ncbi:MAG: hypothetical protein ACI4DV_07715 [Lachnospiraceae bacterium]